MPFISYWKIALFQFYLAFIAMQSLEAQRTMLTEVLSIDFHCKWQLNNERNRERDGESVSVKMKEQTEQKLMTLEIVEMAYNFSYYICHIAMCKKCSESSIWEMALAAAMEMAIASATALAIAARDCDRCKMFAKQITIFISMPFREECERVWCVWQILWNTEIVCGKVVWDLTYGFLFKFKIDTIG